LRLVGGPPAEKWHNISLTQSVGGKINQSSRQGDTLVSAILRKTINKKNLANSKLATLSTC